MMHIVSRVVLTAIICNGLSCLWRLGVGTAKKPNLNFKLSISISSKVIWLIL